MTLPDGTTIEVFDVLHLMAKKIEAFRGRGGGVFFSSQDFKVGIPGYSLYVSHSSQLGDP